jgi:photosystem II stability/assembly factor-like uncharacterized protein
LSDDNGETWQQNLNGLTTPLLSTLGTGNNGALFAGSLNGELFYSLTLGLTWEKSRALLDVSAPVTAIACSPNIQDDGTVFAATDGAGLLVSRSTGVAYEDSSFGLNNLSVLALAISPDWSEREVMFAATPDGVFVSRNGGRAWRETDLVLDDDDVVDALALSPNFEQDHTIYAGTEGGSLYYSTNDGRAWDLVQQQIGAGAINALWMAPSGERLVVAAGSELYATCDGGDTWERVAQLPSDVLALVGDNKLLLVGLHDAGLWKSFDGGKTFVDGSQGIAARGFALLKEVDGRFYASGPQEGLWVSDDRGNTWRPLSALNAYLPLTAFATAPDGALFVASQLDGILRSTDEGASWQLVYQSVGVQAISIAPDKVGLAGTLDGQLLASLDGGRTWNTAQSPCENQAIVAIVSSTTYAKDNIVLMGSSLISPGAGDARVILWRSTDRGANWRQITTQSTDARWLSIAMPTGVTENAASQAILATGPYCLRPLRRAKDVWISTHVDPNGANTLSVVALNEVDNNGMIFAATGAGVYRSIDGGRTWQRYRDGMTSTSLVSIIATRDDEVDTLYALSLGGILWKRTLN